MSFWEEIKRRKVVHVAVGYSAVAWLLVQIVVTVEAPLNLPGWMDTFVIVLVLVGFPLALILSWAYDLTSTGIVHTKQLESINEIPWQSMANQTREQDPTLHVPPDSLAVLLKQAQGFEFKFLGKPFAFHWTSPWGIVPFV